MIFIILTFFIVSIIFIFILTKYLHQQHEKTHQQHKELLLQEAVTHFETMLMLRHWNAGHGGVYVKQRDGISPNPYLIDNVIRAENNTTLIKVNPAWMTRQVNDIINKGSSRYYHITSLKPLNPSNAPDLFELEALNYFEKNADKQYYYKGIDSSIQEKTLPDTYDFMGRLDTKEACLECHAKQGYEVGDLRGGIRISIPTDKYEKMIELEDVNYDSFFLLIISLIGVLLTLVSALLYLFFKEQFKLEKFNQTLEDKVEERTQELNNININLEKEIENEVLKSHEKDQLIIAQSRQAAMGEMISMIAHQWRQPISNMAMDASNMIVDIELDNIDKEEFKQYAQGIIKQTDHLSKTIDDFRNFFREQKTKETVLPSNVVQESINIVGASLKSHGISHEIVCVSEQEISIYSRELLQVLLNLINNAKDVLIEHATHDAHINIIIAKEDESIVIKVCDNGIGIPEDILPKIFDPYFSTKDKKDGTGLGLYMSKIIIETNLKGRLFTTREENETCFVIQLNV